MRTNTSATKRAFRMAAMSADVAGSYVGYLAQRLFLGEKRGRAKLKAAHTKAARRMSDELLALRGPAMKLGQALSLQAGLLPEEVLAELSKLQMQAPGMHPSLVRAQITLAFGSPPEDVFRTFNPEPFAAASLGQVHRAVTREGEAVAVKIQYPGIRDAVANDFRWFRAVSKPAQASSFLPKGAIDELERQIVAETDYRLEAGHIEFFRQRLAPLPFVSVPRVHQKYSTDRILTMSVIEGRHMDEYLARRPSRQERDELGAHLFELFYFQVLKVGAFQADPQWGNYYFDDRGRVGMVDFGCVKTLKPAFAAHLRRIYIYPGRRDTKEFGRLLDERHAVFGEVLPPATRRALMRFADTFYRKVYPPEPDKQNDAFDFGDAGFLRDYMRESSNLLRSRGLLPEYIFLARAETGLYHTLHRLGARVHTSRIVLPYLDR